MNLAYAIDRLNQNAVAIQALVTVDEAQARWRPAPDEWSILEVLSHLVDEEREDFRQRLDYTLHRPGEAWPATDPPGWVISRSATMNVIPIRHWLNFWLSGETRLHGCGRWTSPTGHRPTIILRAGASQPAICWHRGWRMMACTYANWWNCSTPTWPWRCPAISATPVTGNSTQHVM